MNEKFETLLQDEEFAKKLFSLEDNTEIQSFLAENGVEFSLEEIAAIKAGVEASLADEDAELSDDMLGDVSGGSTSTDVFVTIVKGTAKMMGETLKDILLFRW